MSERLQAWLDNQGSFMQALRAKHLRPSVVVLQEQWAYPTPEEAARLALPLHRYAFIRVVEIQVAAEAFMYARTVIPAETLVGPRRLLEHLGRRSLGSVLFADPGLARSPFRIQKVLQQPYSDLPLWQRESLFHLKKKPLLLREVFLPPLVTWLERGVPYDH